jgi:hypothetical protein
MDRVPLGNTGIQLSPLGMGAIQIVRHEWQESLDVVRGVMDLGVNWFDTARAYGDSELRLGQALEGVRDQVILMTKSHADTPDGLCTHIDESLQRLRTDHVDVLFFHGGGAIEQEDFLAAGGMLEVAQDAVQAGKIRFLGFSAHKPALAMKALEVPELTVSLVPANFISREFIDGPFFAQAQERGLGVLAMKPFGGGRMGNPRLCLKFLKTYPGLIPCIGIEHVAEMAENIEVWESAEPLGAEDEAEMERIRDMLGDRFCRGCNYCQPCPQDVPISTVAFARIFAKQLPREQALERLEEPMQQAEACIECRECIERCPYDLSIPEMIRDNIAFYRTLLAGA